MKILSIDDHELFRKGLKYLLKGIDEDFSYEDANTAEEAIVNHRQYMPDLILLDYYFPHTEGVEALKKVKSAFSDSTVVVISSLDKPSVIRQTLDNGAAGFVPKSSSRSVLVNALKISLAGDIYLPAQVILDIGTEIPSITNKQAESSETDITNRFRLTRRQADVVTRVVKGLPNKLIADEMNISEGTVKSHLSAAFKILGVTSRTQAVVLLAKTQTCLH